MTVIEQTMAERFRCTSVDDLEFLLEGLTPESSADDVLELYHEAERLQHEVAAMRKRARAAVVEWLRGGSTPREIELEGTDPPKRLVPKRMVETGVIDKADLLIEALDLSSLTAASTKALDSHELRTYNVQVMRQVVASDPLLKSQCLSVFGGDFVARHFMRAEVLDLDEQPVFVLASVPARKRKA